MIDRPDERNTLEETIQLRGRTLIFLPYWSLINFQATFQNFSLSLSFSIMNRSERKLKCFPFSSESLLVDRKNKK